MTDKIMQINFLPQDIELIKGFIHSKGYFNRVTYSSKLDGIYIDMSKVKDNDEFCLDMTELIISLIKKRDLKDYIWKTYTNIDDKEKNSVYSEALNLFDKKQDFIKETVFSKVSDLVIENKDLNLDGFFKFRMKDFVSYISILSDIALEEHLIKRDKKEFLDSLKYFIDIQEEKMNLLRIVITKQGHFILSDENGKSIENFNNEEIRNLAIEENLNSEDILISAIMTLCPKKIEILDKINNQKSNDIIEIVSLLFEKKVTVIYSN
ncbi:putative sporulation protein YtxC [Terrisporobacter sp.]